MKKFIISIILITTFIITISFIAVGNIESKGKGNIKKNNKEAYSNEMKNQYKKEELVIYVYMTKKQTIERMQLEEYVKGVVASEMPAEFPIEALKAQAVAARTYALSHTKKFGGGPSKRAHGADVNDTTDFQVFMNKKDRMKLWPKRKRNEFWDKITNAVDGTEGQVITYNGELVMSPYYFSTSSGKTEDAVDVFNKDVPYLKSVKSPGEEVASKYISKVKFSYEQFANCLNNWNSKCNIRIKNIKNQICILERSRAGGVLKVRVGNKNISGTKFRMIFNLNSSNFHIDFCQNKIIVTCRGYGHGVGMSQWGSKSMAGKGYNYKEILTHYYKGTEVTKLNFEN